MGFVNNNTGPGTGAFPASIQPMPDKVTLPDNYINFQDPTFDAWTQQYLPELYEARSRKIWKQNVIWFLKNGWGRNANDLRSSNLV